MFSFIDNLLSVYNLFHFCIILRRNIFPFILDIMFVVETNVLLEARVVVRCLVLHFISIRSCICEAVVAQCF